MENYKKTDNFTAVSMRCTGEQIYTFDEAVKLVKSGTHAIDKDCDDLELFVDVLNSAFNDNFKHKYILEDKDVKYFSAKQNTGGWIQYYKDETNCVVKNYKTIKLSKIQPKEMNYTITKDQIKDLHQSNSIEVVREKLEKSYPDEFPKLEVGKWYDVISNSGINLRFKSTKLTKTDVYGYGFCLTTNRYFKDSNVICLKDIKSIRELSPEEVTEALTKEAVKRYKVGDKIKKLDGFYYGGSQLVIDSFEKLSFEYEYNCFSIKDKQGFWICVMKNGIWAEVLPNEKTQAIDEIREKMQRLGIDKSEL